MQKRYKLGVLFYFDDSWMGGVIYIQNLIRTLEYLPDEEKPEILLFYRPGLKKYAEEINYPYITKVEYNFVPIWKRYIHSWILRENVFVDDIVDRFEVNALFPIHDFGAKSNKAAQKGVNLISWFADLQYKYYPQFVSKSQIWFRNMRMHFIKKNCDNLVVSSDAVSRDMQKFYQVSPSIINVFRFVSIVNEYSSKPLPELLEKYKLPSQYFIVSNQFHKHKNHKVVLQAVHELNKLGITIHVAFTGKLPFDSNAAHLVEIRDLIEKYKLESQIIILGLMPRDEQLALMKYSQAVIQPSYFEGWSTVIEDAMALDVPVISSDLEVNIEQLGDNGIYFNPDSKEQLTDVIKKFIEGSIKRPQFGDYNQRIKDAAALFMEIVKKKR